MDVRNTVSGQQNEEMDLDKENFSDNESNDNDEDDAYTIDSNDPMLREKQKKKKNIVNKSVALLVLVCNQKKIMVYGHGFCFKNTIEKLFWTYKGLKSPKKRDNDVLVSKLITSFNLSILRFIEKKLGLGLVTIPILVFWVKTQI